MSHSIARHLTAITRRGLSRPMQTLAQHQFLNGDYCILDYGCGKGNDVCELKAHGITATGYDPVYAPITPTEADIVNLGFVINVIENPQERAECLRKAFQLSNKLLVVSAMLQTSRIDNWQTYNDGVITQRNTFQKYYQQTELRNYINSTLQTNAIAVGAGIFYIFSDLLEEQTFLAERQHTRRQWTQLTTRQQVDKSHLFIEHETILQTFWEQSLDLGRFPDIKETENAELLKKAFGSWRKLCQAVQDYYDADLLKQSAELRKADLLVYFALNLFERRKPYTQLADSIRLDIKAFFGDYKTAQQEATQLLFSVGKTEIIAQACQQAAIAGIGYLEGDHSLQLHTSQLSELPAVLRVYAGCATQLYGDIETADLIKLHIQSGKVSLLRYADFADNPLPLLQERIKIKLREQDIDFFDYSNQEQPLFYKSRYIPKDFPHFEEQQAFDIKLAELGIDLSGYGVNLVLFKGVLQEKGYKVNGFKLSKGKLLKK